jgi:hypothetical protein
LPPLFCPQPRARRIARGAPDAGFFFRWTTEAAASIAQVGCRRMPMLPDRNDSQAEACRPSQEGREIGGRFEASGDEDDRSDNWPRSPIVDWARPRPAREPGLRSAMGPGNGRRPVEGRPVDAFSCGKTKNRVMNFLLVGVRSLSAWRRWRMTAGADVQPGARGAREARNFLFESAVTH